MMQPANPLRGEASIELGGKCFVLRPSFEALVAAEEELGSLFAIIDRAAQGSLKISEIAGLVWHCLPPQDRPQRAAIGEAVLNLGMVEAAKPLRAIFTQVLKGRQ